MTPSGSKASNSISAGRSTENHLCMQGENDVSSKQEVVPRVMALAYSLLPQVERQFNMKRNSTNNNNNNNKMVMSDVKEAHIHYKTTGLDEDDPESGLCVPELSSFQSPQKTVEQQHVDTETKFLPPSAAKAMKSLLRLSTLDDCSVVSLDDEDSDSEEVYDTSKFEVFEKAGDALLNSIRNETITPHSLDLPFWEDDQNNHTTTTNNNINNSQERNDKQQAEYDTMSVSSYDDEDDLRGEMNRLRNVVTSLRTDLSNAEVSHAHVIENDRQRSSRRPLISPNTLTQAGKLKTWRAIGKSLSQENYESEERTRVIDSASSLYWAVALIWAIVILLSGHVKYSSEMKSWPDFLSFMMRN